jgi:hypothetical protein
MANCGLDYVRTFEQKRQVGSGVSFRERDLNEA